MIPIGKEVSLKNRSPPRTGAAHLEFGKVAINDLPNKKLRIWQWLRYCSEFSNLGTWCDELGWAHTGQAPLDYSDPWVPRSALGSWCWKSGVIYLLNDLPPNSIPLPVRSSLSPNMPQL